MKKVLFIALSLVLLAGCGSVPSANTSDPSDPLYNMVLIPSGTFKMGCDPDHNGGFSCVADSLPLHVVTLDAYYIDMYEVTNVQYAECVAADGCGFPSRTASETRDSYFANPEFDNYPVLYVTWKDADAYCTWAGKRLPTEAEWEMAARGTKIQAFPWGDDDPTCTLANSFSNPDGNACTGDTSAVGTYPKGNSVFGVADMAGNVWEWVSDWYAETYYSESPAMNPLGPDGSSNKVLRGGGWGGTWPNLLTAGRTFDPDFNSSNDVGFRCAVSAANDK